MIAISFLLYLYVFLLSYVWIHFCLLKKGGGTLQEVHYKSFEQIFSQLGYKVFIPVSLLKITGVVWTHQISFYKLWKLKRKAEARLKLINKFRHTVSKDSVDIQSKIKSIEYESKLTLFLLRKKVGFDSVYLKDLTDEQKESFRKTTQNH